MRRKVKCLGFCLQRYKGFLLFIFLKFPETVKPFRREKRKQRKDASIHIFPLVETEQVDNQITLRLLHGSLICKTVFQNVKLRQMLGGGAIN